MPSNLLITGGAGYIGSHVVFGALDAGNKVTVVDDLSTGHRACLPSDVHFVEGDVGDKAFIDEVLRQVEPTTVLHFAGSIIVPESIANPIKYYANNTSASLTLIEACVQSGSVSEFIFSSTAAIYGMPAGGVATEGTEANPINPYGRSKWMTEQILSDTYKAYGLNYAVLRYFNVAGADPQKRTGQFSPDATHLIKKACQAALGTNPNMRIFGTDYDTPDGTCVRDFIHVSDLADAHLKVIDLLRRSGHPHTLNCGNGAGYSVRQVIAAVEAEVGHTIPVVEAGRREGDPPKLIADASKLQSLTRWRPKFTDLASIVRSALEWEERL